MSRRSIRAGGAVIAVGATLATSLVLAGGALAIPWDMPGAVPPSQTPAAETPDPYCEQSYANDRPAGGSRIEFGIGPRLAGEAGAGQTTPVVPENRAKRDAALLRLKGGHPMTVRLNRLFQADGAAGIRRFKRMARHYSQLGLDV